MPARFYAYRDELVAWDLDDPVVIPGSHDCRYWAQTFKALLDAHPELDVRVVITHRLDHLPLSGPDVVVLLLNDDLVLIPDYSHDVGLVLMSAGTRVPLQLRPGSPAAWPVYVLAVGQHARVQALRVPSRARGLMRTARRRTRAPLADVPLGTFALREVAFVPFADRDIDVWFRGSRMYDEAPRSGLRARIENPKTRSRHELLRVLKGVEADRPDLRTHVATVRSFHVPRRSPRTTRRR